MTVFFSNKVRFHLSQFHIWSFLQKSFLLIVFNGITICTNSYPKSFNIIQVNCHIRRKVVSVYFYHWFAKRWKFRFTIIYFQTTDETDWKFAKEQSSVMCWFLTSVLNNLSTIKLRKARFCILIIKFNVIESPHCNVRYFGPDSN